MTPWAIKNPLNMRVVSSGNGSPIPPRMRRRKIPKYGKWFKNGVGSSMIPSGSKNHPLVKDLFRYFR
jgi:hypothetical protein